MDEVEGGVLSENEIGAPAGRGVSVEVRRAGAGVVWLTAAKFYFMITGMALVLLLPSLFKRFAGEGEDHVALYGDYRVVMGLINWFNMVLIGGTLQAVAKFVSENPARALWVRREGFKLQTLVGGACTLLLVAGAPVIAGRFYGDSTLAWPMFLAAPIVLLYAYYAVVIGVMNGLQRFRHQATMDMLFATLKVGLTLLLVAVGFGTLGAIAGFLATAAVMLGLAWWKLGSLDGREKVTAGQIFSFEWKTLVYAFFLNGLLQVDLQLLKGLLPDSDGGGPDMTGVYAAVQQIAQIPYVATIAVAFVVFPLVSKATFDKDMARARMYVASANRYIMLALAGAVLVMACEASGIVGVIYPAEYGVGAELFSILAVGYLFFAGMVINANIITAAGRPGVSMALFGVALGISAILNVVLVPELGARGAAVGSAIGMASGFAGAGFVVFRRFGSFIPLLTLLRGGLALAATWAVATYVLPGRGGVMWLLVRLVVEFGLFVGLLFVVRELRWSDLRLLLRRQGAGGSAGK